MSFANAVEKDFSALPWDSPMKFDHLHLSQNIQNQPEEDWSVSCLEKEPLFTHTISRIPKKSSSYMKTSKKLIQSINFSLKGGAVILVHPVRSPGRPHPIATRPARVAKSRTYHNNIQLFSRLLLM